MFLTRQKPLCDVTTLCTHKLFKFDVNSVNLFLAKSIEKNMITEFFIHDIQVIHSSGQSGPIVAETQ